LPAKGLHPLFPPKLYSPTHSLQKIQISNKNADRLLKWVLNWKNIGWIFGCWLLVVGCWLSVICYLFFVLCSLFFVFCFLFSVICYLLSNAQSAIRNSLSLLRLTTFKVVTSFPSTFGPTLKH